LHRHCDRCGVLARPLSTRRRPVVASLPVFGQTGFRIMLGLPSSLASAPPIGSAFWLPWRETPNELVARFNWFPTRFFRFFDPLSVMLSSLPGPNSFNQLVPLHPVSRKRPPPSRLPFVSDLVIGRSRPGGTRLAGLCEGGGKFGDLADRWRSRRRKPSGDTEQRVDVPGAVEHSHDLNSAAGGAVEDKALRESPKQVHPDPGEARVR
jgi:hypothetical protein